LRSPWDYRGTLYHQNFYGERNGESESARETKKAGEEKQID